MPDYVIQSLTRFVSHYSPIVGLSVLDDSYVNTPYRSVTASCYGHQSYCCLQFSFTWKTPHNSRRKRGIGSNIKIACEDSTLGLVLKGEFTSLNKVCFLYNHNLNVISASPSPHPHPHPHPSLSISVSLSLCYSPPPPSLLLSLSLCNSLSLSLCISISLSLSLSHTHTHTHYLTLPYTLLPNSALPSVTTSFYSLAKTNHFSNNKIKQQIGCIYKICRFIVEPTLLSFYLL